MIGNRNVMCFVTSEVKLKAQVLMYAQSQWVKVKDLLRAAHDWTRDMDRTSHPPTCTYTHTQCPFWVLYNNARSLWADRWQNSLNQHRSVFYCAHKHTHTHALLLYYRQHQTCHGWTCPKGRDCLLSPISWWQPVGYACVCVFMCVCCW